MNRYLSVNWPALLLLLSFPAAFVLGMRELSRSSERALQRQYELFLLEESRQRGVLIIPVPEKGGARVVWA